MATGFISWITEKDQRTFWEKIMGEKPKIVKKEHLFCYLNGMYGVTIKE